MRAATLLTMAALLAAASGCDRLPGRGGAGQPCFGNGQCAAADLECNADDRCVRTDCTPDCDGKCGGAPDGCGGSCEGGCDSGLWCDGQSCTACGDDDAHCGTGCIDCTANDNNRACVPDGSGGHRCGCESDADCDGEDCIENSCGGTCPDPCQDGWYCDGGDCSPCEEDMHCGAQCHDCPSELPQHPVCRADGNGIFHCVCITDAHCEEQEICDGGQCAAPPFGLMHQQLLPEGTSVSALEMYTCNYGTEPLVVVASRMEPPDGTVAFHAWRFDSAEPGLSAVQGPGASPLAGVINSVAASKSSCSVFAAADNGNWARIPYLNGAGSFDAAVDLQDLQGAAAALLALAPGGAYLATADNAYVDLYQVDVDSESLQFICTLSCDDDNGTVRALGFTSDNAVLAAACDAAQDEHGMLTLDVRNAANQEACNSDHDYHYKDYPGLALAFATDTADMLAFLGDGGTLADLFLNQDAANPAAAPEPIAEDVEQVVSMVFADSDAVLLLGGASGKLSGRLAADPHDALDDDYTAHLGCPAPLLLDTVYDPSDKELLISACGRQIRIWDLALVLSAMGHSPGR